MDQLAVLNAGSPPRMRGKALDIVLVVHPQGITPAYAGKRPDFGGTASQARDHPRVCGEKVDGQLQFYGWVGSPPRMRGKDCIVHREGAGIGDHPRVCGEKYSPADIQTINGGSPPRMRGKELTPVLVAPALGITPAYAGKSPWTLGF